MKKTGIKGISAFVALIMLSGAVALYADKKGDAVSMIKKVEAFYKKNGKEKMLEEIQKDKGQFEKGEIYVYVIDDNATVLAHPKLPSWKGKSFMTLKDADGKLFVKDAIEQLKTKKEYWSEYKWNNPETKKVAPKMCLFYKMDDMILACGYWK